MSRKSLRYVCAVTITVLAAATLAACSGTAGTGSPRSTDGSGGVSYPLTLTDASGQKLKFDKPATKIGCYWSGCDEILADLGLVPHASSSYSDETGKLVYPAGAPAEDVTKLGGEENPESWAKAGVDLIIVRGPATASLKAFEAVAPVLYLYAPGLDDSTKMTGLEAYKQNVVLVAQAAGLASESKAKQANDRFDSFMKSLASKAPAGAASTTVAPIFQTDDGSYTMVAATSAFCVALKAYKIGTCAQSSARDASTWQVNAEAFLAMNPDWIAYLGGEKGGSLDWTARTDAVWNKLKAVQENHVYNASGRIFCCSLRTLAPSLQEYAYNVWGATAGIADPGPVFDYKYNKSASPLAGS